jgi:hypothetical protein
MSDGEWQALRGAMRARYAVHYSALGQTQEKSAEEESDDEADAAEDGMEAEPQAGETPNTDRSGKGSAGASKAGPDDLDHADTSASPKL